MTDLAGLRVEAEHEIERYLAARRERVDAFVTEHFSLPAVAKAHRRTLTHDLWRLTLNLALALPSLVIRRAAGLAEKLGFDGLTRVLERIPLPLATVYEKRTEAAMMHELFEIVPGKHSPLLSALEKNPKVAAMLRDEPELQAFLGNDDWLRYEAKKCVQAWAIVRAQVLDGLGSFAIVAGSYFFFSAGGHSPLDVGRKIAGERAKQQASESFFLGKTIGNVFYSIAPVKPTMMQVAVATAVTFLGLALLTLVVNFAADPLQRQFGAQHRQLHKVIDALEERLVLGLKRRLRTTSPLPEKKPYTETIDRIMDRMGASASSFAALASAHAKQGTVAALAKALAAWEIATYPVRKLARRLGPVRTTFAVIALCVITFSLYEALRYDPYEEPEDLIADHAYATALARLDVLQRQKAMKNNPKILALRAQALCGSAQYDACIEVYDKLLDKHPDYRTDTRAVLDLAVALATSGHKGAERLIVRQVGPDARALLEDLALEKRPLQRFALVDALTALGTDNLPWDDYIAIEMDLATTCADKKRVVDKLAPKRRPEAVGTLEAILADPALKCAHVSAKNALARIK